jgi:hypothetical protein
MQLGAWVKRAPPATAPAMTASLVEAPRLSPPALVIATATSFLLGRLMDDGLENLLTSLPPLD